MLSESAHIYTVRMQTVNRADTSCIDDSIKQIEINK